MSKFSVLFTDLLEKKNVTIYGLAQSTNIDRTYLQKIKKGERLPKDPDFLTEITKAMHLTQIEARQLYDAFELTILGEDKFLSHKEIAKIINTIFDVDNSKLYNFLTSGSLPNNTLPTFYTKQDENSLSQPLKHFSPHF